MGAKTISLSADNITYAILPGSSGDLSRQAGSLDDTIFGQTYKSMQPGIINWQVTADAVFKGYPGYVCAIKKPGTATVMTAEATTFVSGKTYQITASTKRVISRADALTVLDNAVDHTVDVLSVDFLTGQVTFKSTYTVTGPVTVTGKYLPLISLGAYTSFTLTQTMAAIKDTSIPTAQANGGNDTFRSGGLREVTLQLPAIFASADAWDTALTARSEYVIEINPDGVGSSVARGFFKLFDDKQSGNVGALEEETLQFHLVVPQATGTFLPIATPFGWTHASGGVIPTAVKTALDAFQNETAIYVKYLPDGVAGWSGQCVVTNMSLSGGLDAVNKFSVTLQGSGQRTTI